jgi:hypothetical protein
MRRTQSEESACAVSPPTELADSLIRPISNGSRLICVASEWQMARETSRVSAVSSSGTSCTVSLQERMVGYLYIAMKLNYLENVFVFRLYCEYE